MQGTRQVLACCMIAAGLAHATRWVDDCSSAAAASWSAAASTRMVWRNRGEGLLAARIRWMLRWGTQGTRWVSTCCRAAAAGANTACSRREQGNSGRLLLAKAR